MPDSCECHDEVARLHRFFQDWFQGKLDEDAFGSCELSLAPDFTIVTPGGELIEREQILEAIRRHRGGETPEFSIRTVGRSCQRVRGAHVTTYEEHQSGARSTIRLSTAVISEIDDVLRWHTVHETWMST